MSVDLHAKALHMARAAAIVVIGNTKRHSIMNTLPKRNQSFYDS